MNRRTALLLGVGWMAVLAAVDGVVLLSSRNLQGLVKSVLDKTFAVDVRCDAFEGGWPGDIVLRNVRIPRPDRPLLPLARIEEVRIVVDWGAALLGRPPVEKVVFARPWLDLEWRANATLDMPSPFAKGGGPSGPGWLPELEVDGLSLSLRNTPYIAKPHVELDLDHLRARLVPQPGGDWRYNFHLGLEDDVLGSLDASGHFSADSVGLELRRDGVQPSERLRAMFRDDIAALLGGFELGGRSELTGSLAYDPRLGEGHFSARAFLDGVDIGYAGWPQRMRDLRGIVNYERGHLLIDGELTGELEGGGLRMRGGVDFTGPHPVIDLRGTLSGLEVTDELVSRFDALPHPGPVVCEQLRAFEVRGPVEAEFTIGPRPGARPSDGFTVQPDFHFQVQGCRFVYRGSYEPGRGERVGFPYPLQDVWGVVHVTDLGLDFEDVHGGRGTTALTATATVDYHKADQETFHARVVASRVPVDEQLLAALDPDTRAAVELLRPQGFVNVTVVVSRGHGDSPVVHPEVIVDADGLRVVPQDLPYALDDVYGRITSRDSLVKIESLRARHGTGTIHVEGKVGLDTLKGLMELEIDGIGLPVDDQMVSMVAGTLPDRGGPMREFRSEGRLDLDLSVRGERGSRSADLHGLLAIEGAGFDVPDTGLRARNVRASVALHRNGDAFDLRLQPGAAADLAGIRFQVDGAWTSGSDPWVQLAAPEFEIDARVQDELATLVPAFAERERRVAVSGPASAQLRVVRTASGVTVSGALEARGLSVRVPGWPMAIEDVTGLVRIDGAEVSLNGAHATVPKPGAARSGAAFDPTLTSPFGAQEGVSISLRSASWKNGGIDVGDLVLSGVPLEPWLFRAAGMGDEAVERLGAIGITGTATLLAQSVSVRDGRVLLSGADIDIEGLNLSGGRLYLERARSEKTEIVVGPGDALQFEGELSGRNLRLLGIPVPRFEGKVNGDRLRIVLSDVAGVVLGFVPDRFLLREASLTELRARARQRRYATEREIDRMSEGELREFIRVREELKVEDATRLQLVEWATALFSMRSETARRLRDDELRAAINDARQNPPLGKLDPGGTRFAYEWGYGRFELAAKIREVHLGAAVRTLGGDPGDARGLINGRVGVSGTLADMDSFVGEGNVSAEAHNIIQLPLFLNIVRAVDLVSTLRATQSTKIQIAFHIRDRLVHFDDARLTSNALDLTLVPPGAVSFGGIIDARLDVRHHAALGIPLLEEIFGLLPTLFFGGVEVQGPLEDPTVIPRSLGVQGRPVDPRGRKPVLKDPKLK